MYIITLKTIIVRSRKHNLCTRDKRYHRYHLHSHAETLLMISHLLVLLNFFSHFLLYGHSCQWSVGTVKHVQSPSAFNTSPASCKMSVLISKTLWALKLVPLQPTDCKHPTLTQQLLWFLQAAWAKTRIHREKLIRSLYKRTMYICPKKQTKSNDDQIKRVYMWNISCAL